MSQLPPDVVAHLEQLLKGLASADNTTRSQAEESLAQEWIAARPDLLLSGLAEQTRIANNPQVRG